MYNQNGNTTTKRVSTERLNLSVTEKPTRVQSKGKRSLGRKNDENQDPASHAMAAETETKNLVNGAINGMLQTLDPHSNFMDPRTYAQMRERQEGRYYGLGVSIAVADGDIIIAAGNDGQYRKLCEALGAPELANHPDYAISKDRVRNRVALTALLHDLTRKFTRAQLLPKLDALGWKAYHEPALRCDAPVTEMAHVVYQVPAFDPLKFPFEVSGLRLYRVPVNGARELISEVAARQPHAA